MPIKGLDPQPRLPLLGKLRKGGPKGERTIGQELKYFRFVGSTEEVTAAFEQAAGKEPSSVEIYLPFIDLDRNWDIRLEARTATHLLFCCDDEEQYLWRDGDRYSREPKGCPYGIGTCQENRDGGKCTAKPKGTLTCISKALLDAGYVGYVQLLTGSWNDIRDISASLKQVATDQETTDLRGIEFTLRRQPRQITFEGKKVTKHMVTLAPSTAWTRHAIALQQAAVSPVPSSAEEPPEDDVLGSEDARQDGGWDTEDPDDAAGLGGVDSNDNVVEALDSMPVLTGVRTDVVALPKQASEWQGATIIAKRPYDPETVRRGVQQRAKHGSQNTVQANQVWSIVRALEGLFPNDAPEIQEAKRYGLLKHLVAKDSCKKLTVGEQMALMEWCAVGFDPSKVSDVAIQEAAKIIEAIDILAGQKPLVGLNAVGEDLETHEDSGDEGTLPF